MRHQIPGLHSRHRDSDTSFDGVFLVRVERAWYRRHQQKDWSFFSRLYCTERALWRLHWFLRDFGYDADLLNRDQVDEKALLSLRGVVRTSHKILNGRSYENLDSFAPAGEWEVHSCAAIDDTEAQDRRGGSDGL